MPSPDQGSRWSPTPRTTSFQVKPRSQYDLVRRSYYDQGSLAVILETESKVGLKWAFFGLDLNFKQKWTRLNIKWIQ